MYVGLSLCYQLLFTMLNPQQYDGLTPFAQKRRSFSQGTGVAHGLIQ